MLCIWYTFSVDTNIRENVIDYVITEICGSYYNCRFMIIEFRYTVV